MSEQRQTKSTPGPWHVGGNGSAAAELKGDLIVRVWASDRASVADVSTRIMLGDNCASPEMLANARLIAAAPDLLRVCEMMLSGDYTRLVPMEIAEAARAAIARAKG